jgi:catechol 2,3-dioxygenase-like lactoylglutathione lyase family enzyme
MQHVGVLALGVSDVDRAARFWCEALGYDRRVDGFGGWSVVLVPRSGSGTKLALQRSDSAPEEFPRIHLDLHVASEAEQAREVERLVTIGAERGALWPAIVSGCAVTDRECRSRTVAGAIVRH